MTRAPASNATRRAAAVSIAAAASIGATALLVSACSLRPRPDPSRFYVLTSLAETGSEATGDPLPALHLGVGPVTLPRYLTRSPIVTRSAPNRIVVSEVDRWAEPLDEEFARVLAENLAFLLGTEHVRRHPWYASERVDLAVEAHVLRFERDSTGVAELLARWSVRDPDGREIVGRRTRLQEPAEGATTGAAVAAQSRAAASLAREIAAAIRRSRPGG